MRISDWSSDVCSSDLSAHVVKQRLRLGAVSPKLLQVYREDGLTLDQLMAFAITEDHERQEQVFGNLHHNREPGILLRQARPPRSTGRSTCRVRRCGGIFYYINHTSFCHLYFTLSSTPTQSP